MRRGRAPVLLLVALSAGCRTEETLVAPDPHLQRMLKQPKVVPYDDEPLLPHGMSMQAPPEGTLPAGAVVDDPLVESGQIRGHYAERVPIRVDRALVEVGRRRFETFCAACHGALGDGDTPVAARMTLRKPPSLHEPRIAAYPPGRVFRTIREGYGLMPGYADVLSTEEAWGVALYVRALELSRHAQVARLPAEVRAQLATEAP
jgi:mono/diheme cytochrome c family protein